MKNLIPKNMKNNSLIIWKKISIVDFLIFLVLFLFLSSIIIFLIPIAELFKILLVIFGGIIILPLFFTNQAGYKIWYLFFLFLVHLFKNKKYETHNDVKHNTLTLIPEVEVKDYFIKLSELKNKRYLAIFQIKGSDIFLLNEEERELKFKRLQEIFKLIDFPFSIMKIDEPIDFQPQIAYYEKLLAENENDYQNKIINYVLYKQKERHLFAMIANLEEILPFSGSQNLTKKIFILLLRVKKKI